MILKELLRVVEEIKKDLEYTKRLEERWLSEQKRFPLIYKYIIKQRESFKEQIDKAMTMNLDESKLDEYVVNRLGIKTQKLKTAQITPPKEEPAPEPVEASPAAKAPEPEMPRIEKPAVKKPEIEKPNSLSEEDTKDAQKALEEAAAAAALKMRGESPEPPTGPIATKKEAEKPKEEPAPKPADTDKLSSKEKLRKLASEVLSEVKKSKTT
jgi:hypothetical protein